MRKLMTLIIIALIVVVGNFGLWFLHTRTITGCIETVKKQLLLKGIELNYKEIKFTNFLSWDVKAIIENPSIKYGSTKVYQTQQMERIHILSQPFKNEIKLIFPMEIESIAAYDNIEKKILTKFQTPPSFKIELFNSLSTLEHAMMEGKVDYRHQVQEVFYINSPFQVIDQNNKDQIIYSGDGFTFWIVNKNETNIFSSGMKLSLSNLRYNQNYIPEVPEKQNIQPQVELGAINVEIDTVLREFDQLNDKVNQASESHFNMYELDIKNIKATSDIFGARLQGKIEKATNSAIPFFDLKLDITNYKKLIEFYANIINRGIDNFPEDGAAIPFKLGKVTEEQINSLAEIIRRLSVVTDKPNDVLLEVVRKQEGDATISGKPMILVFQQLQALFFGNISSMHRFPPAQQESLGMENNEDIQQKTQDVPGNPS